MSRIDNSLGNTPTARHALSGPAQSASRNGLPAGGGTSPAVILGRLDVRYVRPLTEAASTAPTPPRQTAVMTGAGTPSDNDDDTALPASPPELRRHNAVGPDTVSQYGHDDD